MWYSWNCHCRVSFSFWKRQIHDGMWQYQSALPVNQQRTDEILPRQRGMWPQPCTGGNETLVYYLALVRDTSRTKWTEPDLSGSWLKESMYATFAGIDAQSRWVTWFWIPAGVFWHIGGSATEFWFSDRQKPIQDRLHIFCEKFEGEPTFPRDLNPSESTRFWRNSLPFESITFAANRKELTVLHWLPPGVLFYTELIAISSWSRCPQNPCNACFLLRFDT
jgi:hypothetical protein